MEEDKDAVSEVDACDF